MTSRAGTAAAALAARFEGYRERAYQDGGGVWTVGYGTTRLYGRPVTPGDTLTEPAARALKAEHLAKDEAPIRKACRAGTTENQIAAFLSLAYNVGLDGVLRSTALREHNAGRRIEAALGFTLWRKDNGIDVPGLLRRRMAEAELYLTP